MRHASLFGTALLSRAMKPTQGLLFGNLGRMAARGVVVSLSRTGVATAALVVAVSATIGGGDHRGWLPPHCARNGWPGG